MTYRDRREARAERLRGWAGTREERAAAAPRVLELGDVPAVEFGGAHDVAVKSLDLRIFKNHLDLPRRSVRVAESATIEKILQAPNSTLTKKTRHVYNET